MGLGPQSTHHTNYQKTSVITVQHPKTSKKGAKGCGGDENQDLGRKKKKTDILLKCAC